MVNNYGFYTTGRESADGSLYWRWFLRAVLNASKEFACTTLFGRWFQWITVSTKKECWYKNWNFLFYCSNIAKSENAMLWRMFSRLETCIVYSCIWSVTLAKSIVPRKTWRKLWHICDYTVDYMCRTKTSKSPHAFAMCSIRTDLLKQENEKIDSL
jgi:hypothetical protein